MGEKDISEKILMDYNDVFADIINVCAFNGKEIIEPIELANTSDHSQYKAEDGKLHEEERDVAKYWKQKRTTIALYGLENQSTVDLKMPFRVIGYDGAAYRSQLLDKRKSIVPVASFVLYFGTKTRWCKKKSIKEIILYNGVNGKAEVKTMCEVADRLKTMGKNEGIDEERLRIIRKKMEKGMNAQEIADLMELPVAEVKNFMKIL